MLDKLTRADRIGQTRLERWGGWRHCKRDQTLCWGHGRGVDLARIKDAAGVLTTIHYVSQKQWATDECLAGLVRALGDIFGTNWTTPPAGRRAA